MTQGECRRARRTGKAGGHMVLKELKPMVEEMKQKASPYGKGFEEMKSMVEVCLPRREGAHDKDL